LATANLRSLGVSRSTLNSLRKLAQEVVDGAVDFSAPSECVIESLKEVPGITSSMAEYIALRALGEPDAFPSNDPVLRLLARNRGQRLSAQQLEARSQAWRPWRGYAALHLWCASES